MSDTRSNDAATQKQNQPTNGVEHGILAMVGNVNQFTSMGWKSNRRTQCKKKNNTQAPVTPMQFYWW